ncbi:universal stress protein [Oenococcus sicerae]|uniref:Universal stress protein n=1 Tax=Oenococcus sicerae TaxID=2203724 RepID=A0AAJ1R927_9LACO|nr:universal stress protein [Oenococcus sicerae]MDN6899986.1 universal stress protein [Oenococcus sicerae]QAS70612.1 universal stress protein [Oenococcus sicerae]
MTNKFVAKQFKHVLAAVDDSPQGQSALNFAIHQAEEDHAKLTILSVLEEDELSVTTRLSANEMGHLHDLIDEALVDYEKIANRSGLKDSQIDKMFAQGDNAGETVVKDVLPNSDIDLVVVGAHSRTGWSSHLGSQASYIAKTAPISVTIIRDQELVKDENKIGFLER